MAYLDQNDSLWETLQSIAGDEGLVLYDAERVNQGLLRVVVDRPKNGGPKTEAATTDGEQADVPQEHVSSGDCTKICKRLRVFFAAEGTKFGLVTEPQIDVSSPGINRELRIDGHFANAIGERIKVVYAYHDQGKPRTETVVGLLTEANHDAITVEDEHSGSARNVPFGEIRRANVDFSFRS